MKSSSKKTIAPVGKPNAKPRTKKAEGLTRQNLRDKAAGIEESLKGTRSERSPEELQRITKALNKEALREISEHSLKSTWNGVEHNPRMVEYFKEQLALQVDELRIRFLFLTDIVAAVKYRYEWLEKFTGIPATRWKNVLLEQQLPTLDMIIAICNLNPGYGHWLMYGSAPNFGPADILGDPNWKLRPRAPSETGFRDFIARRDWILSKRKSKTTTHEVSLVDDLRLRFLFLTEIVAAVKYRYEWLEKFTGVSAARWQNVLLEKQLPTLDMLISISNLNPGYAHWLVYGSPPSFDDPNNSMRPRAPSDADFNDFKARRDWILKKKEAKAKAKVESK